MPNRKDTEFKVVTMRKNFAEVLKSGKVDIMREYSRLYDLLYGISDKNSYNPTSLYENINDNFYRMWFRGTAITLEQFDEENGFSFEEHPKNFNIDYFVLFCEYFYNITRGYMLLDNLNLIYLQFIIKQIDKVIAAIGYMPTTQDGFTVFVEQSQSAVAVSEILEDKDLSYKTIYYNHHSMQGDIEGKKEILLKYASILEPKEKMLNSINPSLKKDLFYLFNNLNIRHNNIDCADKGNYKRYVSEMKPQQIEKWYDETYQMCLLAFLEIEQCERKKKFDVLKESIENTK